MFTPLSSSALRCIFRIKRLHLALDLARFCRRWNSTFFQVGKNISPWCYLPRIEEAGQGPPKWPNPAGVPLDTDLRQHWNFELRISQRAANSTQRVSCSQMCTRNRCWGSSFFFILISQHSAHGLWSPASCLSDPQKKKWRQIISFHNLKYYESQKTDFMLLLQQLPSTILCFRHLSVAYHFQTSYIFCTTLTLA